MSAAQLFRHTYHGEEMEMSMDGQSRVVFIGSARHEEIMRLVFDAMFGHLVTKHTSPSSERTLSHELRRIAEDSGVPIDELMSFLEIQLPGSTLAVVRTILKRELDSGLTPALAD